MKKAGYLCKTTGYWKVKAVDHPSLQNLKPKHRYILNHRLVMEAKLGRYLTSDEFVLHKDGNNTNDDPENLVLGDSKTQNKVHKRVKSFMSKGGKMPPAWSRGKTKKDFPQLSKHGVKKGNIPWNKNKKGYKHRKPSRSVLKP